MILLEFTHNDTAYEVIAPDDYVKPKLPWGKPWVAELRSGKYKQCTGALCNGDGYCCLGILSKLQGRLRRCGRPLWLDGDSAGSLSKRNPIATIIGETGSFWVYNRVVVRGKNDIHLRHSTLASMNDAGFPFSIIADVIEAVWELEEAPQ